MQMCDEVHAHIHVQSCVCGGEKERERQREKRDPGRCIHVQYMVHVDRPTDTYPLPPTTSSSLKNTIQ